MRKFLIGFLFIFCIFVLHCRETNLHDDRSLILINKYYSNFKESDFKKISRMRCKVLKSEYFHSYELAIVKTRDCEIVDNFTSKPSIINNVIITKPKLKTYEVPTDILYILKSPKPIVFKDVLLHKSGRIGLIN